ncbi:hydroquinone glucosyltransferase-like [Senna tora]|uniref:Glycosyltransferase n=1 Tax=Senna tora TaxID=362788 RepID=A0A834WQS9_9FABA|nr:hydroquinone glucosyltransferase-like [Senna tora]
MEHSQSPTPKAPLVALMPTPGMGHLIPMIEFAKRLVVHHHLSVVLIIPTDAPPSKAQTTIETLISLTVLHSLPSLRHALRSLSDSHRLLALAVDLFGTDAFDVAAEFDVSPYIFYPSTAMALSLFLHLPRLDEAVQCEYRELQEPVRIPGCVPVHGKDLLDPVQDRKDEAYKWLLHHCKRYHLAEGIIENSFSELEPGAIKALQSNEPGSTKPPVYAVGPLVKMENAPNGITQACDCECLRWLDDQPRGSVLFVSFGSGGTLSTAQMNELALGLEMSEQRFIWVVRSPNDGIANASYFSAQSQTDPYSFLPKGFVERTKGRGLLVASWAPQAQVLSHASTGGFLTHCGWNSILESVVNGVPLVAWPLYAEQRMNAVMMTEEVRVALRPKASESGIVEREEIARVVKDLMEVKKARRFATE